MHGKPFCRWRSDDFLDALSYGMPQGITYEQDKKEKTMKGWEALKALGEGKKVRRKAWHDGMYALAFDRITVDGVSTCSLDMYEWSRSGWELYVEIVSFAEALKHMEAGGEAKQGFITYRMKPSGLLQFRTTSCKWADDGNLVRDALSQPWKLL